MSNVKAGLVACVWELYMILSRFGSFISKEIYRNTSLGACVGDQCVLP